MSLSLAIDDSCVVFLQSRPIDPSFKEGERSSLCSIYEQSWHLCEMGSSHSDPLEAGKTVKLGHETTGLCSSSSNRAMCCEKMAWGLGLVQQYRQSGDAGDGAENNKSWLLADATAEIDPSLVNSSFRFSFGSEAEAEEVAGTITGDAMVLLLASLEDEDEERRQWEQLQSRRRRGRRRRRGGGEPSVDRRGGRIGFERGDGLDFFS